MRKHLGSENYGYHKELHTNHSFCTNAMSNIPLTSPDDRLYSWLTDTSEEKVLLRPDQKSVNHMMNVASKLYQLRELVLDTDAGTLATGR